MSAATSWRSALFLAILMAIIGPLQMTGNISVDFAESNRLSDHSKLVIQRSVRQISSNYRVMV